MLKALVALAATCVCLAMALTPDTFTTDKDFVTKQKAVYDLLYHVDDPLSVLPELQQLGLNYQIKQHLDSYNDQTVVQTFLKRYKHKMIPHDAIFSVYYPSHVEDAKALFDLLYTAKDFTTFYNTAAWARLHVNPKLYTYVMIVAVLHRPDTKYIQIPALYEVMPHFFFNNEVIQQVYRYKMGDLSGAKNVAIKHPESDLTKVIINANYSGWYLTHGIHSEEQLTYFTEDVGLNAHYFYWKHEYPFWMPSDEYHLTKIVRGEVYHFVHHQLLARYNLERLAQGLGHIEDIDWHRPITTGYHPSIVHANGMPFPHRPTECEIPEYKYDALQEVEAIENFVHQAIGTGRVIDEHTKQHEIYVPDGFRLLANIIEGNADSVNRRYYGSLDHLYKRIMGFNRPPLSKHEIRPSALEFFSTNLRDPGFYRIYKRILGFMHQYRHNLPTYTRENLIYPGVKIESVAVDKLTTYFDHFDSEISAAGPVSRHPEGRTEIYVRQHRLNHKPFVYHITVNSDKVDKAMIRIFIGPKYDVHGHEINIEDNWANFFQVDQWVVNLNTGINKIERSSHESVFVNPDQVTGATAYAQFTHAINTGEQYTTLKTHWRFPDRLLLPKGKKEGLPLKMFVFVGPIDDTKPYYSTESLVWGTVIGDGHPMGYPMDRPIDSLSFSVPNVYFKDVMVYHKITEELTV